jgi:hypothetical protein
MRVRGLAVGFLAGCVAVVAVVGMRPTRAFADETGLVPRDEPGQHRTAVGYFLAINGAPQFSDPNPDNDLAWLTINATGDDQAAGGSPTVGAPSVTSRSSATPGAPVAFVHRSGPARLAVGLLAVLAVAAAAILALLRRRRPWPTVALPSLRRPRAQPSPSTGSEPANSDDGAVDGGCHN